jgi:glycosyltransferase involved in cell wall biosynthesis
LLVKKPKLFHLHGNVRFYKKYPIAKILFKNVTDSYISITRELEQELLDMGISNNRIIYLPNAVDTNLFNPQGEKEENLLLFVGRVTAIKGLTVLLESLRHVKTPCHLVIVGPADSTSYSQKLMKIIEEENKRGTHKIECLGNLENTDTVAWYRKASIFILPSFEEAFPVVLLEALSCGTPVIATNVGGVPEVVQNHENGLMVPPNNPLKLAESIQWLLDNESARTEMGKKGRDIVLEKFSLQANAKKLGDIYQKIMDRK